MKTKFIILLFVSFAAGFFIGSLATGRITKTKVEKIKSMNAPNGFREFVFKTLQATEGQKVLLTPVLDSFSGIHWQLMKKSWEEQEEMFNRMDEAIRPIVDEKQFNLLMEAKRKFPGSHSGKAEENGKNNSPN